MPYFTNPEAKKFEPTQRLPHHLYHKPIYALPYQHFDGTEDTDAQYITIGLAQWNEEDASVKVMRFDQGNGKWSRASEELPLHRPIDMTLFMAMALFDTKNGYFDIPNGTFHDQDQDIHLVQEQRSGDEVKQFNKAVKSQEDHLKERLNKLFDVLNKLKSQGKL